MQNSPENRPRALVVFEPMFGNTEGVAHAVAAALRRATFDVTLREVGDPFTPTGRIDADLVVVGAPTQAFALSRPVTRADAVRQGAPTAKLRSGLREWLAEAAPTDRHPVPLIAFDTRVQRVRRSLRAAAPRATILARLRGFDTPVRPAAFLVGDAWEPLLDGELSRAESWVEAAITTIRKTTYPHQQVAQADQDLGRGGLHESRPPAPPPTAA